MLNVLDLFSGTGELGRAFKEALESFGVYSRTAAYCESERYAQGILLSRMLRREIDVAPIGTDVKELRGEELPEIDAIVGGFPCQDISTAGRGAGLVEGERSSLFFEIIRLARDLRPQLIALENVPAITLRGGLRVVAELAALGYDSRWFIMGADEVGATHKRDRWWLLAYASGERPGRDSRGLQQSDGRQEPGLLRQPDSSDEELGHANESRQGSGREESQGGGASLSRQIRSMGDTKRQGLPKPEHAGKNHEAQPGRPSSAVERSGLPERPPSPGDVEAWERILETFPGVRPAITRAEAFEVADPKAESGFRRVADGLAFRNDRIRALGNGVDFVCAKEAFKALLKG